MPDQPDRPPRPAAAGAQRVSHTHDGVFRLVFSKPAHAASQLRAVLPPQLAARLDLDQLTAVDGSFIDSALRWRHTDVLLRTRLDGHDALIYVVIEHQSRPDPLMPWRILRYLVQIWERHLTEHPNATRLPAIVPIVVYQGRRPWTAPVEFSALLDLDPDTATAAAPFLPRLRFLLDDLTQTDEHQLRARPLTPAAQLTLLVLGAAPGNADVAKDLSRWLDTARELLKQPDGIEILRALVTYIHYVSDTPTQHLHQVMARLGPEAEEAYMTTADVLRAEGEAKGHAEGHAKGHAEGRAEGHAEGHAEVLMRLLTLKFGTLPDTTQTAITTASAQQLQDWTDRVLTATTLDDIFS